MELSNADIREIELTVPRGHHHLRSVIRLQSGEEIVLQEATVANLVRGYITVKTHPKKKSIRMRGTQLNERKKGFADWQLLE
jgi:hypothetical protein